MDGLALVADIGGTHARFALVDLAAPRLALLRPETLEGARFASVQHAARHYLDTVGEAPRRAAIAVASPLTGDEVRMTNRAWSFLRGDLQAALGVDELRLLNDFGAVAHAVPALQRDDVVALHGDAGVPLAGPVTVLGPGTGLGVALLVPLAGGGWQVVETEAGHVGFAPQDDEDRLLARWFAARHGRVSNERLLCGTGLAEIDAVLRGAAVGDVPELRTPAAIVQGALEGQDAMARRALARFCAVLGSVAGDCALAHGARTVVIAGGMVPRFIPFLRSSAFRERFLAKGRFADWLAPVPIRVVTHPHPGLLGAAVALQG